MKRFAIVGGAFLALLLLSPKCEAVGGAELMKEAPISYTKAGTAITVSVSTSAWTLSNTSASKIAQRSGFRVTNPAANSTAIYALCHASAPTEAITVRMNEVQPGENLTMPCDGNLNLYLLSLTAAQNIGVWEFGQ